MKKTAAVIAALALICSCLTACGRAHSLEEYFDRHEGEKYELFEKLQVSGSDLLTASCGVSENEISVVYTFTRQLSSEEAVSAVEQCVGKEQLLNDSASEITAGAEEASGIEEVTLTVTYLNNDGALLWTRTMG